jgi:integrase
MARAKGQSGKTIYGYGKSQQDAEGDLAAKLEAESTPSISPDASLHDIAKQLWYPSIAHLKPLTRKKYEGTYVTHIRPNLGHRPISEITTAEIQRIINATTGGARTAIFIRDLIGQILKCAESEALILRNAARFVKVPSKPKKRNRVLSVIQAQELLAGVEGTDLAAPVFLAAILGLRRGEVAGLQWSDLDRQRGELLIQRQRQAIRPQGIVEVDLKTDGSRRVLRLRKSLIDEIDRRGNLDSDYICTYRGEPWVPDTITEKWNEAKGAFDLDEWHFHDLRHGAAGLLYAAGNDIIEIAAVLGHAKPDMSLIYTGITDERQEKAMDRVSELLGFL